MNQEKIGKFISERRKAKKYTQADLADIMNVSKNAISKWERGINMPDVSIMQQLCVTLEISLNELFAGETLEEKEVIKQSEQTILEIIKSNNHKKKRYTVIIVVFLMILVTLLGKSALLKKGYIMNDELKHSQMYVSGETNIKGDVDIERFERLHIDFDIGANKYGYAVFKQPKTALQRLKKDYSEGLKLIQKEFNLLPLNCFNFRVYGTYGWQVTGGTESAQAQAQFVSSFMDIYENSFN